MPKGLGMSRIPWKEATLEGVLSNGTRYKAKCWYWAKDVNVRLIDPYPELTDVRHIMYLAPFSYEDNDSWRTRAVSLVKELVLKRQSEELERQAKTLSKKTS